MERKTMCPSKTVGLSMRLTSSIYISTKEVMFGGFPLKDGNPNYLLKFPISRLYEEWQNKASSSIENIEIKNG